MAEQIGPIVIPVVTSLTNLLKPSATASDNRWEMVAQERAWEKENSIENKRSLLAGQRITDRFNVARSATDDGRKAVLADIDDKLKKALDVIAKGGLSEKAAKEQTGLVTSLEGQKRSIQDAQQRSRQAESELRRLREDSKFPGLESPIEFQKLIAERQKSLDIVGKGNEGIVDEKYLPKIQDAIRKFFERIGQSVQKEADKTVKDSERRSPFELQTKEFQKDLKDKIAIAEAQFSEAQSGLRIIDTSDRDAAKQQQSKALRLAELQGGESGGGVAAVNLGTQFRVGSANDVRADALRQIKDLEDSIKASVQQQGKASVDDEKQLAQLATQRLQTEAEYRKEIDDAHMDAEVRIAEIQKQQLESYKQEALSIFEALQRPNGIREFLKGQTNQLLGGIFSNAAAPVLQKVGQQIGGLIPGQTDANGQKTGLGKIFSGTILDSDRAKSSPEIKSRDTNTAAINKLTATISGTSVGGQGAGVASGSPADSLSKLVSGSDLASGSPAAALTKLAGGDGTASVSNTGAASGGGFLGGLFGSVTKLFQGLNPSADLTGSQRAGNILGSAATVGTGIYEAVNQFGKGGASGAAGGIGAAAGTAALVDPEPISKGILSAVSIGLEAFKALLPDARTIRQAQITNQTQYDQYVAPPTLNRNLSTGGFETYTDKTGHVQVSPYNSIEETQPYKYLDPTTNMNNGFLGGLFGNSSLYQNWQTQPGQVVEPYQAPPPTPSYASQYAPAGSTVNLTINALDSKSVLDNSGIIATAVQKEVRAGHPVGLALQQSLVGT